MTRVKALFGRWLGLHLVNSNGSVLFLKMEKVSLVNPK